MLKKFYTQIVFKYAKTILALIFLLVSFLGYHAFSLKIDASPETLLLENDKDLAYSRLVNQRYRSPDFLVIAYTPKENLLSQQTLTNIKNLSDELLTLPLVTSITSLRNVPLLQSPPRPVRDLVEHIPSIEAGDVNLTMAKTELLTNPMYSRNIVSMDFKTTAIIINLKYDSEHFVLLDKRNQLRTRSREANATQSDKRNFLQVDKEFALYRENSREAQHDNIVQIRHIMQKHKADAEMFLGGINMIADDLITFVKNDLKTYGVIVLLLLIAVLWVLFKQLRWVLIPVVTLTAAIVSSIGFLGLFSFEITVISLN